MSQGSAPSGGLPRTVEVDTVTATEEGRSFFQARLSVFGLCLFLLAGTSWLLLALAYWLGPSGQAEQNGPFSRGGILHLSNALLAGALWLATRSGRRQGAVLHAFDAATSLGLIAVWGLAGLTLPAGVGGFIALLSFTLGTLARAIAVPSTARRTLAIGLFGTAMLAAFSALRVGAERSLVGGVLATACWALSATTIATFASHTIFGLRREVQQARVLGQYTLETKIGEGGMGDVWRASHALLRRPTAIKLLPPGRLDEKAIQRFEREVRLTAGLSHPNIVAIYDYGRTRDGVFYYAMELLEGTDLERLVGTHGAQSPERVVHILTQLCGALGEAHDHGLVHRDIKPANVLLSPRRNEHEFAKLVDFGLVKPVTAGSDAALTGINALAGTPLYMAPEAIQDPELVDGRSDLYSLAALAWFLLVGRPPFEGQTVIEVCAQHLHATPRRPSEVLGAPLPEDLEGLLLSCLEKRPEARPPDARTLRRGLEACAVSRQWTAERAIEWWARHAPSRARYSQPSAVHGTIALDVAARDAGRA